MPSAPSAPTRKLTIQVMDRQLGDSRTIWDPTRPDEVAAARAQFDELKKKGYLAYKVTGDATKGEEMKTFDPEAGKIIMAPQMRGG